MSTWLLLLASLLTLSAIVVMALRQRGKPVFTFSHDRIVKRPLNAEEYRVADAYLEEVYPRNGDASHGKQSTAPHTASHLTAHSQTVYRLNTTITRYSLSTNGFDNWRYYLDADEVLLPACLEPFITTSNHVELIKTRHLPLIIELNGQTLQKHYRSNVSAPITISSTYTNHTISETKSAKPASIRQEQAGLVDLVEVRKENAQEYALRQPGGIKEALGISLGLLLFFVTLIAPPVFIPWLLLSILLVVLTTLFFFIKRRYFPDYQDIHVLHGTLKHWRLFGENSTRQTNTLSFGALELTYPPHWQRYLEPVLNVPSRVEIDANRQLVRIDNCLSLSDEMSHFPLYRWGKNIVLSIACSLILILLLLYVPLTLPLKVSLAWLQDTKQIEINSLDQLEQQPLHVGDQVIIRGTGTCPIPQNEERYNNKSFMPFDCSRIYWNHQQVPILPTSNTVKKAEALLKVIKQQLHQNVDRSTYSPRNTNTSDMIQVKHMDEMILKTAALCAAQKDCLRLKSALLNLNNAKSWSALLQSAREGKLKNINVLLRPITAASLDALVINATSGFIYNETHKATEALQNPATQGVEIASEEEQSLVHYPAPPVPFYDYNALDQWTELQRLSEMLTHTPFRAEGLVTEISKNRFGVTRISLHKPPDTATLWRYLCTGFLLIISGLGFAVNFLLALIHLYKNRQRLTHIQAYYALKLKDALMPQSNVDDKK